MTIANFFYCENKKEHPGAGFILYACAPYFMASVYKFKEANDLKNYLKAHADVKYIQLEGYNILIVSFASLENQFNNIRFDQDLVTPAILEGMRKFYLEEKILPNESYHKRFLTSQINTNK